MLEEEIFGASEIAQYNIGFGFQRELVRFALSYYACPLENIYNSDHNLNNVIKITTKICILLLYLISSRNM